MPYLDWISDEALISSVQHLITKAKEVSSDSADKFNKNVIDPFSAVFQMAGFGMTHEVWYQTEIARQAQKSLQNHVGIIHQSVLGGVEGWEDLRTGSIIDLVNHDRKIIAELKNKYNTLSGGQLAPLYRSLENLVTPKSSIYFGYTAYYVEIIPKKPIRYDKLFTPSDKDKGAKVPSNEKIRQIDGASFYSLVTDSKTALADLFAVIPEVVSKVGGGNVSDKDTEALQSYFKQAFG
ncbi:Eco47II family restriction endonuclease [Roseivirga pacifica]|uniref:Eco47II family restriction endonuclease n=1 Tax=Roseivirga pacifica TaxID=1267423 RepID=UPI00227B0956|nr:Eco47II family restriction endonuclease [Roseivirga pacifica]